MGYFDDLKIKLYKNILGDEFNDFDIKNIIGAVRFEYNNLANHLDNVSQKLKGKNDHVIVEAVPLKGDYLLTPKFKKVVNHQYVYKQVRLTKYNKLKKASYENKDIDLDDEMKFISEEKLKLDNIHPYFNDELEKEEVCFEEKTIKANILNFEDKVVFNDRSKVYYVFDNKENYRELTIDKSDISFLSRKLGIDMIVEFHQNTFTCNMELNNNYFSTTTIEKNSLRMKISGNDREDNVFADVDYFFENVEGKKYAFYSEDRDKDDIEILNRYRDRSEVVIRKANKEPFDMIPSHLMFEASTVNIDRQKKAFRHLFNKPLDINKGLLKLPYGKSIFPNETKVNIKASEYRFLSDTNRDGTKEQRLFVEKALATKDFMLLSGPPGTGKTTCILELIYQILSKNPKARILLSASTHVAIDNVLERIVDEFENDLDKYNIYPVRLGNESNVVDNENVKQYIYEVIKEKDNTLAETYLRCANVVCGTAMGINKYLNIGKTDVIFEREKFDYLIIDEASKTTLQEYIVPAVMCEKHILIGDIKQLSPYTDTFLLEVILKSQPQMTKAKEDLFYLNFVLNKNKENKKDLLIVIDDKELIKQISEFNYPEYSYIYEDNQVEKMFLSKHILVSTEMYLKYQYFIPKDKRVITLNELPSKDNFMLDDNMENFVKRTESIREIADNIIGGNWAKEVAWRYARFYELSKMDTKYREEINWLIIESLAPGLKESIEKIGDISIPSILTKLQEGVSSINGRYSNRLEDGFTRDELKARFVNLIYQHRMHPAISKYAENSIYDDDKFTSSSSVADRKDKLGLFKHSNIFVGVHDGIMRKKENEKEAQEIVRIVDVILKKSKDIKTNFTVGILTFYKSQQKLIKEYLNRYLKRRNLVIYNEVNVDNVRLELYTVDKYQGREADVTIVSLSRNSGLGFMNVPNRINVGLTRAKYYRIVVGDKEHFKKQDHKFLHNIVFDSEVYKEGELL